jgi:Polyketide cyclase / dehydrase and lipid transport
MGTFRLTIDIRRPAADVFAFVAEPRNMPLWYEAVERVDEITPKTSTRAPTYHITRSLPGGRADNVVEVTASTPNLTVTFESRQGPTPFRYRYAIEPDGGGSLLILDADISGAGLPGPLGHLDGIATRAFKHGMRQNLEGLKHLVESAIACCVHR